MGPGVRPRLPYLGAYHPGWIYIDRQKSLFEGLQLHVPLRDPRQVCLLLPIRIASVYRRDTEIFLDVQVARFHEKGDEGEMEGRVVVVMKVASVDSLISCVKAP